MVAQQPEIISDDTFWCYLEDIKQSIIKFEECAPDVNVGVGYLIESAYGVPDWQQIHLRESNVLSPTSLTLTSKKQFINKVVTLLNALDSSEFYAAFYIYSQLRNVDRVDSANYLYFSIYIILLGKNTYYDAINNKMKFDLDIQNALANNSNEINISPLDFLDCFADDHATFYHEFSRSPDGKSWLKSFAMYSKINESALDSSAKNLYPNWYANTLQIREANKKN